MVLEQKAKLDPVRDAGTGEGAEAQPADRWTIDRIYSELIRRICTLEYPFKRRLGELELAGEFGVSRTPIREVLQRLEAEGLIDIRHGVGSIVIAGDPETLADIYSLRLEVAELISKLSPLPITDDMIEDIQVLRDELSVTPDSADPQVYFRINQTLHSVINRVIGNAELAKLHDLYYFKIAPFWYRLAKEDFSHEKKSLDAELAETQIALQSRDIRALATVHRNHTAYGMIRVKKRLADIDRSQKETGA